MYETLHSDLVQSWEIIKNKIPVIMRAAFSRNTWTGLNHVICRAERERSGSEQHPLLKLHKWSIGKRMYLLLLKTFVVGKSLKREKKESRLTQAENDIEP